MSRRRNLLLKRNGNGIPRAGLLAYFRESGGTVVDTIGVSVITIVSGSASAWSSASMRFESGTITDALDTALGGDILFDSANSYAPFEHTWSEWANVFASLNQTRIFWGIRGAAIYDYSQDDVTAFTVNRYLKGWGTYYRGYGVYGTVQEWTGLAKAHFYVDANNGNDSNDGSTPHKAFSTITKLLEQTIASGTIIGLASDSYWQEELVLPDTIAAAIFGYGAGKRPEIDAADIANNANFSLSVGYSNTYEIAWATSFEVPTECYYSIWEDGDRLTYVTDISTCESTPGSYCAPSPSAGQSPTFYIHPTESTDPTSNGKVYEISKREYCFMCESSSLAFVKGSRASHESGPIQAKTVRGVFGYDGIRHNVFTFAGNCIDSLAWKHDIANRDSATLFVCYSGNVADNTNIVFSNCIGIDNGVGGAAGLIHAHTGGLTSYKSMRYVDIAGYNTTIFTVANVENFYIERLKNDGVGTTAPLTYTAGTESNIFNDLYVKFPSGSNNLLFVLSPGYDVAIDGLRLDIDTDVAGSGVINQQGGSMSIRNSVVYGHGLLSTSATWERTNTSGCKISIQNTVVHFDNGYHLHLFNSPDFITENNCYYDPNLTYQFRTSNTNQTSLSGWQSATGQDVFSVAGDPLFTDAANGDFTLQVNSPAAEIVAGLLRPDVQYLDILSAEIMNQW